MSNAYSVFLKLLPSQPTLFGVVVAVDGEQHEVELLGGGVIVCMSQKVYELGAKVYVKDKLIVSDAPDNTTTRFDV